MSALSPERYSAVSEHAFTAAAQRQLSLERQLSAWRGAEPATRFAGFATTSARRERFASSSPEFEATRIRGTETMVGGAVRRGAFSGGAAIALGRSHTQRRVTADATTAAFQTRETTPLLFAQFERGAWFANATAGFARADLSLQRRVTYSGVDASPAGKTKTRGDELSVTLGREFRGATWHLTPQVGVLGSNWRADDFQENAGGANALGFRDWSNRSLRSRTGFDFVFASRAARITPRFSAHWLHEFETSREIRAGLAQSGGVFISPGRQATREALQTSLGLAVPFGPRGVFDVSASSTTGDGMAIDAEIAAGVRWVF